VLRLYILINVDVIDGFSTDTYIIVHISSQTRLSVRNCLRLFFMPMTGIKFKTKN